MDKLKQSQRLTDWDEKKPLRDYIKLFVMQLEQIYADVARCVNHLLGYQVSATWNPGSIADGAGESMDVTVTGANLGDFARASFSLDTTDLTLTADVTAADTVTVRLNNNTGGAVNLAEGTVRVKVFPK